MRIELISIDYKSIVLPLKLKEERPLLLSQAIVVKMIKVKNESEKYFIKSL